MTAYGVYRRVQSRRVVVGTTFLMTVAAVALQGCRFCERFCPAPPALPPASQAELIIDDEHAAVWSHFENDFASDKADHQRVAGILVQVGAFYDDESFQTRHTWFDRIEFKNADGTSETLREGDFDWINIKSARGLPYDPMTAAHADHLFPTHAPKCRPLDDCFVTGPLPHTKPAACSQQLWSLIEGEHLQPCLRHESLHSHFVPFGVLTYWQGEDGYTMAAGNRGRVGSHQCAGSDGHNCFSFRFTDKIDSVDVHLRGAINTAVDQRVDALGTITRIIIHPPIPGDRTHGGVHKPGTDN